MIIFKNFLQSFMRPRSKNEKIMHELADYSLPPRNLSRKEYEALCGWRWLDRHIESGN